MTGLPANTAMIAMSMVEKWRILYLKDNDDFGSPAVDPEKNGLQKDNLVGHCCSRTSQWPRACDLLQLVLGFEFLDHLGLGLVSGIPMPLFDKISQGIRDRTFGRRARRFVRSWYGPGLIR